MWLNILGCEVWEELGWALLAPLRFDATWFDLEFELGLGYLVLSSLRSKVLCLALHLKHWCLLRHCLIWWPCWRHNLQSWYCWTISWRYSIGNDLNDFWHLRRECCWFGHRTQLTNVFRNVSLKRIHILIRFRVWMTFSRWNIENSFQDLISTREERAKIIPSWNFCLVFNRLLTQL